MNDGCKTADPPWCVYIIEASDGRLYTGITTDVERRFGEHSGTSRGARFFRGRKPVEIVYTESHPDRGSALRRESAIKKLKRGRKLELIAQITIKPPGRPC
ncbi:MAG: GIY-YIG nuclease family protein [Lysobacterales bacterium]